MCSWPVLSFHVLPKMFTPARQLGVSASLQLWGVAVQLKDLDFPSTTPSFRQYHVEQVAADVKETIGRVSDGAFDAEQNASIPTVNYEVTCTIMGL